MTSASDTCDCDGCDVKYASFSQDVKVAATRQLTEQYVLLCTPLRAAKSALRCFSRKLAAIFERSTAGSYIH